MRHGMHPPWRRRKVHLPPFPPAVKTAPAPLLLRSPQRPLRRVSAGTPKRLAEKKTRRARCKRKGADPQCTLRAQCGDAGLRTTLYELARCKRLARVWPDLTLASRPRPGIAGLGCKTDLVCFSFRCRCSSDCERTRSRATPNNPCCPGSAERSGERGKRSRGLLLTTPTNCVPPPAGTALPKIVPCSARAGRRLPKNRKH